ncbi:MAG TPA: DMT family transporter [Candidatus Limnocylindria bacterium]|nr:DMT family transporter [Candidatus Limnocylindria bacterium]
MSSFGVIASLIGALSFGAGDFAGAVAARRAGALVAVAGAHTIGLVALLVASLVIRPPAPPADAVIIGLVAGVAGVAGLAALYGGMSIGKMGIVTSLAGCGSLALPLIAGAFLGHQVGPIQLAGVAAAGLAAAAAGGASRGDVERRALLLAGAAAVSFGAWYVLVDLAARAGDPLWALVTSRAGSSAIVLSVLAVRGVRTQGLPIAVLVAAGLFDVGGNAFFVIAREEIPLGLAAALVGLYPVVTVLLARFLLGEHLPRLGQVGVVLAAIGIVLISLGG